MLRSIQGIAIKINSRLSVMDEISLAISAFLIICLALFLVAKDQKIRQDVAYIPAHEETLNAVDYRPFASKNGPTYTFSWCQGADKIKKENIIYFVNAEEAERSGRTLSKLCNR
jgi:hypothetical protein